MDKRLEETIVAINSVLSNPLIGALERLRDALPAAAVALEQYEVAEARLSVVQAEIRHQEARLTELSTRAARVERQVEEDTARIIAEAKANLEQRHAEVGEELDRLNRGLVGAREHHDNLQAELVRGTEERRAELADVEARLAKAKDDLKAIKSGIKVE